MMRRYFAIPLFGLASVVAVGQTTSPAPLTLFDALQIAHSYNPTIVAAQQHAAAVQANEITASLRANPTLNLGGTQINLPVADPGGPYFYSAGVSRLFERGGKRDIRVAQARATTGNARSLVDDQRRALDLAVEQAFTRMLLAKAALQVSDENLTDYRKTVQLMKVRLDAGDVSKTDFDRIELQLANFENDADNASLSLSQSSAALQTLLGRAQIDSSFDITGSLDGNIALPPLEQLRDQALQSRPDIQAAQKQIDANEQALKLAAANGKADPTLGGEYERSGKANTAGFQFNVPLRVFDRNQGERERAKAELESSRTLLTATRNQALSEIEQAYAAYLTAVKQSDRYHSHYLEQAAHVRDNLQFSYRNGNSTLLDYLSALQDYRQITLQSLNASAQKRYAAHQLSYVTNTEILP